MQLPRHVNVRTRFKVLFEQNPIVVSAAAYLIPFGLLFALVSFIIKSSSYENDLPKVDYDKIDRIGTRVTGQIVKIKVMTNMTDNGRHPVVIFYKYKERDLEVSSMFQVIASERVSMLKPGDEIEIKYLGEDSILSGYDPYFFPYRIFYLIAISLITVGICLLIVPVMKSWEILELYKRGIVVEATIVEFKLGAGFPIINRHRIIVRYIYKAPAGQQVSGQSFTTDTSILDDRKRGDLINVFVSPQDETRSTLVRKSHALNNGWGINGR